MGTATPPYARLFAGCSTGATIVSWLVNGLTPENISDQYQTQVVSFYSRQATDPQAPSYSADVGRYGQKLLVVNAPTGTWAPGARDPKVSDLASGQSVLLTSFSVGAQPQAQTPRWGGSMFTNLDVPATSLVAGSNTTVTADIGWAEAVVGSGGCRERSARCRGRGRR